MDRHILDTLPVVWVFTVIRQSSCSEFWVHSFFFVSALCHPVVPIRCSSWGVVPLRESFRYVYCFFRPAGGFISSASTLKLVLDCCIHFRIRYFSNSILLRKMFVQAILHFHQQTGWFFFAFGCSFQHWLLLCTTLLSIGYPF